MNAMSDKVLHVIGGGLAGSEAAWQAANRGVRVVLHEMRPVRMTDAHKTDALAELVCSNSFRSDDAENNAVGLLHEEMRRAGSLIMAAADAHRLPAGGALAVDREGFSAEVTRRLMEHPNIEIVREEIAGLPPKEWEHVIIATGPLTSDALAEAIRALTGEESLAFFDAIAPIVHADSINMDVCWKQSRYDKGGADYINCPLDKEQYERFVQELLAAEKVEFHEWEKNTPYFDGCLPIEVMAERGIDTLRHGPMKPVGLTDPKTGRRPYAVVQLRQDNALGTLYNMVGFQTKLKYGEQKRIFRMIPGLENAEFARLGGLHRNTFLNSPKLLDAQLRLRPEIIIRHARESGHPEQRFAHTGESGEAPWIPASAGMTGETAGMTGERVEMTERNEMPVVREEVIAIATGRQVIRFAGQMTGVEGYVESAACGLIAGRAAAAEIQGRDFTPPLPTTAHGALIHHITGGHLSDGTMKTFQPMNINFGLFPPVKAPTHDEQGRRLKGKERSKARRRALTARALSDFDAWLAAQPN